MSKHFLLSSINSILLCILILSLPIVICPKQALSIVNIFEVSSEEVQSITWKLEADKLTTLANNTIVEAEGNVLLTKGMDTFKADFIRYYHDTNWVFLKGNVVIKMGQDDINADEAEFNLTSKTGWINNGNIFISSSHTYFSGSHIVKHWGDLYTFKNATLTTCDGPSPAWSISANEAVVELDNYAQLFHSKFNIKDVGILYSPVFTISTKKTRQSGLINPSYGISEKRGLYYTQPYFWVLDESSDLTFYGGIMTKIGPLVGTRYRSHRFTNQKAWFAATGIHDKNTVTVPGEDPVYPSSQLLRKNSQRYWFRGMADGFIGLSTWSYISNIDYVSDQDYLREFEQELTGFSRSRSEMFDMFGRDIQEDDQHRLNTVLVRNDWSRIGLVGSVRYQQDPSLGHGNRPLSQNELTQRLPQADMFFYQGKLLQSFPLEASAHLQSAYMYRDEGTRGWRTELYPKAILPIDLKYGSVTTTLGLRETYYLTDVKSHTSPFAPYVLTTKTPAQTGKHRTLINLDIDSYTQANRVWRIKNKHTIPLIPENIGKTFWTALRHTVQPRISYKSIPRENQEKNPFYTTEDRILPTRDLTYSITNILTRKAVNVTMSSEEENAEPTLATSYYDLIYWQIASGYDFEEERRKQYIDNYPRRPIKDIYSELEVSALSWLSYNGKTFVSPYNGNVTRHDHTISFHSDTFTWKTGLSFRDRYYNYRENLRYVDENNLIMSSRLRLLTNTFSIQPIPSILFTVEDFRNMREGGLFGKVNSQLFEVAYLAQCYRIIGRYRYDGYDRSFTILFELPGILD